VPHWVEEEMEMADDSVSEPHETVQPSGEGAASHADLVTARLERLPFARFHLHMASVLSVGTFFDAFDTVMIGVVLVLIIQSLHIGSFEAGLLVGGATLGAFLGTYISGVIADRYGRKNAFVFTLLAFGLLSVGSALAWNFESLIVFRTIQGVGLGGEVYVAAVLFGECLRGRTRGRVMGLYESIYAWGQFLAPVIGFLLVSTLPPSLSWRVLFLIGGLPVLMAVYAYFRLPESPRWLAAKGHDEEADRLVSGIEKQVRARGGQLPEPEVRFRADTGKTRLLELFSPQYRGRTTAVWVQAFMTWIAHSVYLAWFPTFYVRLGGLPTSTALLLTLITNAIVVVQVYAVSLVIDRVGRLPLMRIGFVLMAIGAAFALLMTTVLHFTPWPVLFVAGAFILVGAAFNGFIPVIWVPELYPTRMRAWGTNMGGSMIRLGSLIAPIVAGAFLGQSWGVVGIFLGMAIAPVIGFVALTTLGVETKQRVLEESSAPFPS
jgi:MFS transporter, putative metabolite:H+ symporter